MRLALDTLCESVSALLKPTYMINTVVVLRSVTKVINLDVFTEQEAEAMLDVYGITDTQRRVEILEWSGRLPVLMSWLAAPQGDAADLSVPTRDIVERFLRWVTEPIWRQVALLAAIPRTFNVDILNLILRDRLQDTDGISALDWLQTMPFVQQRSDGWHYHDVVRRMILQHQRQTSPLTYREIHALLANFYKSKCDNDGDEWAGEEWRKDMLSYLYHYLISDPTRHWDEIVDLLALAVRKHRNFSIEIGELLNVDDIHSELSQKKNNLVDLLCKQLSAMKNGRLQDGFEMFDQLCAMTNLSAQAKCYVYAYRGECYRQNGEWKKAHLDFDKALDYVAEDTWAISRRGETYRLMERYEEALIDFDRAITLDNEHLFAIISRAQTYWLMKRYEEALIDFDRAIVLDDKSAWIIANRGETYRLMERYEEALIDFDRAIVLDDKNSWAFAHRGQTYRAMERYEEALVDLDRAIVLDDKNSWAITNRSLTYQAMERYEEALVDFNRAIVLDDKNNWAFAHRGQTYRAMERYEEALVDLDRAIVQDDKNSWAFAHRGETYRAMERYEEALIDFDRAIAVSDSYNWAITNRSLTYQAMERYEEALVDFNRAIVLDDKNSWAFAHRGETYRLMKRYEEALIDFDRAIVLDDKNSWALGSRGQTYRAMQHYEEALIDFDRAIVLDDKNSWAFAHRGQTYRAMERYEEALVDFNRAIVLDDKSARIIANRGETYRLMKRYEEALIDFDRAIVLDNTTTNNYYNERGLVLSYLGSYAEAIDSYDSGLKRKPDSYTLLYNKAVVIIRWKGLPYAQKYIDDARIALSTIIDTDEKGSALYGLGGLEALGGNIDSALDLLQEAISLEKEVIDWARHDIAWSDLRATSLRLQLLISGR